MIKIHMRRHVRPKESSLELQGINLQEFQVWKVFATLVVLEGC